MNIIFLDVDGVLNSLPYFESLGVGNKDTGCNDIREYHLDLLAKLCKETNANVVISSSWRILYGDEHGEDSNMMWAYLLDSLKSRDINIIGATPRIGMQRPLEIKTWIEENYNGEVLKFVSLDDDFSIREYDNCGIGYHLIKTRFYCSNIDDGGLQQVHVDEAIKKLNEQKGYNGGWNEQQG